ncbi:MAG: sulfotransferase [Roseivirga sp.]|nr:sulfotransferase [Roseivirga sp.]
MKNQIFLTGPGRSGTTLTNAVLSLHPEITSINSWYALTKKPVFNFLGERMRRVSMLRKYLGKARGFPRANEPLQLWRDSFHNFWNAVNDQEPLGTNEKDRFRRRITGIMRYESADKSFMTKMTGPPFNRVLRDIFPDAKIVWVDRDPRAVVLSYIKMGWVGVERVSRDKVSGMTKEELIRESCHRYNHYYDLKTKEKFDYTFLYEDLVEDKLSAITNLLDALGLSKPPGYLRLIEQTTVYGNRNANYELSPSEYDLMTTLLSKPLKARGLV